jgi:CRP/FNR family cyclic AMP-dependent transcriptional regulator
VTYWLVEGGTALNQPVAVSSWPGGRVGMIGTAQVAHITAAGGTVAVDNKIWCLSEVDIFRDLSPAEMDVIAAAAPMKTYAAGELVYSPHTPVEALFILKRGRVRIFRVSTGGRALTTAIIIPGTIFGEMVPLGQRMYDNFAEAVDEAVVCVLNRDCVRRYLLSDPRIGALGAPQVRCVAGRHRPFPPLSPVQPSSSRGAGR